jgi:serine/threonine protein phosphatase PrpC
MAAALQLQLSLGQHSAQGRKDVQQDCHGACLPASASLRALKGAVLALADGIGSSQVSHVASQAAVRAALVDYYDTSESWTVKRSMQRVLAATNSWLHAQTQRSAHRHDHDRGWVCAVAVLVLKGHGAHVFHAGDVRVYRLQGRSLEQLTEDHRVCVGGGQSNLSRALGFHAGLELDYRTLGVEPGDLFVLACDGVHEHLRPADMVAALRTHAQDLDEAARQLVQQALAAGSTDNLTLQIARVDALPSADADEARRSRQDLRPPPLPGPRGRIDGFRIERELHASARSHVYLAVDTVSGRPVALKLPSVELHADAAALDRFALEEWIGRRIDSAHVLKVHAPERPRSALYAVMEAVEGCTLAQWMRDHPDPPLETVRGIVEQIARGLQAFHRLEMLHQDLRPENLMVDRAGTVKIVDFGSVRVAGLAEAAAAPGAQPMLGTLAYGKPAAALACRDDRQRHGRRAHARRAAARSRPTSTTSPSSAPSRTPTTTASCCRRCWPASRPSTRSC